ncbi:MAG TPA: hypothetical protein VMU48_04335 [Terracidiphilus sp.]|nr:hypothetical protein [Terracidiphilus sp.]
MRSASRLNNVALISAEFGMVEVDKFIGQLNQDDSITPVIFGEGLVVGAEFQRLIERPFPQEDVEP